MGNRQASEPQLPFIMGDSWTACGRTFALDPTHAEIAKHLAGIDSRNPAAICQLH
jgi:hypothetical protein